MRKLIVIIMICFTAPLAASNDLMMFLQIPPSARLAAMNCSLVALGNDTDAFFSNPAGASGVSEFSASFTQVIGYQEMIYDFANVIVPLPFGVIGVNIGYNSFGAQDSRDSGGNITGSFVNSSFTGNFLLSFNINKELSFGVNGKLATQVLGRLSLFIPGMDVGILYKLSDKITLGESLTNIGTSYKGANLPLVLKSGISISSDSLIVATEIDFDNDGGIVPRVAFEYGLLNTVKFRAGYRFKKDANNNFSAGLGMNISGIAVDYAYLPFGDLGSEHYFTVGIGIGRDSAAIRRDLILKAEREESLLKLENENKVNSQKGNVLAQNFMKAGKLNEARKEFEAVLNIDSDNTEALKGIEQIEKIQKVSMALKKIEEAVSFKNMESYDVAIAMLNEALRLDEENSRAKTLLEQCVNLKEAESRFKQGSLLMGNEEYKAANEEFLVSINLFPKESDSRAKAMIMSGKCYEKLGMLKEAIEIYDRILLENKSSVWSRKAVEEKEKLAGQKK